MTKSKSIIPTGHIENKILLIRNKNVMLDQDIAGLYGIETKVLVRAMKRNRERFPIDFMFQLTKDEFEVLRSQFGTSKQWGGRRYPPYVFTEQGVAMLSGVLRSERAIQVNIEIIRAFVHLRSLIESHEKLYRQLTAMEKKYDSQFKIVFDAIKRLMVEPSSATRKIGFERKPK